MKVNKNSFKSMFKSQNGLWILAIAIAINMTVSSISKSNLTFNYNSFMIPHPEKAHRGGEDAFYNSSEVLVVADGVGGWNNQGIDPSKYSRFLCASAGQYVNQNKTFYVQNPLEIIKRSQKQNDNVGSSTMEVLTIKQSTLRFCYIGDSGFMIIRKYEDYVSIYESVEQQHGFNYPYQLALEKFGGDDPNLSICGSFEMIEGDIIVVGSDGLYDNIQFSQVLTEVKKASQNGSLLNGLAEKLATTAIERGNDSKFNSPFAKRAKELDLFYEGGKLDDTTVIIAQLVAKQKIISEL